MELSEKQSSEKTKTIAAWPDVNNDKREIMECMNSSFAKTDISIYLINFPKLCFFLTGNINQTGVGLF